MTRQDELTGLARVNEIINALDLLDEFRAAIVRLGLTDGYGRGANSSALADMRELLHTELGRTEHELRRGNHGETS